ncbi:ketopantoate reductase family protein [Candidatus Woesearchaeota archaeon]|nr:ketopantoate reductase family protein [Candidatus Woesearchaeota archaeon]
MAENNIAGNNIAGNNTAENNIAVIGAGPVGSIAAAYLARSTGHPKSSVTVIEPYYSAHTKKIASDGLSLKNDDDTPHMKECVAPVNGIFSLSELQTIPNIIIIATKAFVLKDVVTQLKRRFSNREREDITFVCMQNGYKNEVFLSDQLRTNVCRVAVNYVGNITSPGEVSGHWLKIPNYIGAAYPHIDNKAEELADLLNSVGLYTEFIKDIRPATFLKTILNAALSPVCAATKKTMKEAMDDEKLCEIVKQTLLESLGVAEAIGFRYNSEQANIDVLMSYLRAGGNHPSSMRLDLLRGDKTEIEWINGAIVREGRKYGVETSLNSRLVGIINTLERSSTSAREEVYRILN